MIAKRLGEQKAFGGGQWTRSTRRGHFRTFCRAGTKMAETHRFYEYKPMTRNEGIRPESCVVHGFWVARQDGPSAVKPRLLDTSAAGLHCDHALSETTVTVMVPVFGVFEFERHALLRQDVMPDLSSG
jgi:hypothetical protein